MITLLTSLIVTNPAEKPAIYVQVASCIADAIRRGYLKEGQKLPGCRVLAQALNLHRNTLASTYRLLEDQGWIDAEPGRGSYIRHRLSEDLPSDRVVDDGFPKRTAYRFSRSVLFDIPRQHSLAEIIIDEGIPDIRISFLKEISKRFQVSMRRKEAQLKLKIGSSTARDFYTRQLNDFLNRTRGLRSEKENISIFRTQEMALFGISGILLNPGDLVVVGTPSHFSTNMIVQQSGARLRAIPVDEQGLRTDVLAGICERMRVRMVYINPHHHYPTGAVLSQERRLHLLDLAQRYGFVILEDDYGFDYQYEDRMLLPLAAQDGAGSVIYLGSFGQSITSTFTTGYVVAPRNLKLELDKWAEVLDRYGDPLGEWTLGELIEEGEMHRYLTLSQGTYKNRREVLYAELITSFGERISCTLPQTGLGLWVTWRAPLNLSKLSKIAGRLGLSISPNLLYQTADQRGIRMGFGSLNPNEIKRAVQILKEAYEKLVSHEKSI